MALQKGRIRPNGPRIRQFREEKGWTQAELANKAKIKSVKTISNLESSTPCFSATLNDIATALGLPLASIMQPSPGDPVDIELAVERYALSSQARAVGIESKRPVLEVGDSLRIRCRLSRACHLWLVNLDASGNQATLLPNKHRSSGPYGADEWHLFPGDLDPFAFPLLGPPGVETILAIATNRSVASPEDVRAPALAVGDEIPNTIKANGLAYVLGIATIEFQVLKSHKQ